MKKKCEGSWKLDKEKKLNCSDCTALYKMLKLKQVKKKRKE